MLHGCPREQNLVHHSGSGWLARPSPWGTFTSYSLPAFLAHSLMGQERRLRFAPSHDRCTFNCGSCQRRQHGRRTRSCAHSADHFGALGEFLDRPLKCLRHLKRARPAKGPKPVAVALSHTPAELTKLFHPRAYTCDQTRNKAP